MASFSRLQHQTAFPTTLRIILPFFLYLQTCFAVESKPKTANTTGVGWIEAPDLVTCDPIYGDSLNGAACRAALKNVFPYRIPRLVSVVKQKKGSSSTTIQVPVEYKDADSRPSCMITIDLAGPAWKDNSKVLLSSTLRTLASNVITQCVEQSTWGGFATYGILKTGNSIFPSPRGGFTADLFMTVSVTPPYIPNYRPGDTDPHIPLPLLDILESWRAQALWQRTREKIVALMSEVSLQAGRMKQGGKIRWWDTQNHKDIVPFGMGYQCNKGFGVLAELQRDCREASFEFVNQGDVTVKSDSPLVIKSPIGQCAFRVESTSGEETVSWDAMRSVVDTLLYTCLEADQAPGFGGQVTANGGPGPSSGYQWPAKLVITMGKKEFVGEIASNATTEHLISPGQGNSSQSIWDVGGSHIA